MDFKETDISGAFFIYPKVFEDARGTFVKYFNAEVYEKQGLAINFVEDFFSISKKNVLRGFHFQTPPHDHSKIVYCSSGSVLDVLLDLRVGSPTYGKCISFEMNSVEKTGIYIPKGIAHGFLTRSESATVVYKVTTGHSPEHDHGVSWSSADINWPINDPILSDRDASFPALENYNSPFSYKV